MFPFRGEGVFQGKGSLKEYVAASNVGVVAGEVRGDPGDDGPAFKG